MLQCKLRTGCRQAVVGPLFVQEEGLMFYGWRVAAASFSVLFVIVGIVYYSFPVFYAPLIEEFGWTRAQVTAGFAISIIVIGPLFGISAGFLIDRVGPRRFVVIGLLFAGTAFIGYGWMHALWVYYLFYFLQTAGYVVAGPIPNQVLISNWFNRLRGRAMGLAYVGAGLGGAAAPLLARFLITRFGWRFGMQLIGLAILLVLVPLTLVLVRNRPSDLGLLPDGAKQHEAAPVLKGFDSLADVLRTRAFWLIALGSLMSIGAVGGVIQHLVLFLNDSGLSKDKAAGVASVLLVSSIVGRLIMGWAADRFPKKYVMLAACLFVACAVPILYLPNLEYMSYVFAAVFGFGMGADYMLIPLITAHCFGLRSLGRIMGVIITTDAIGQALTPVIVGHIFDVTRSYNWAFALLTAMGLMGALAISLVTVPQVPRKQVEV
ncbi:MAG TPA: MFS transporter [Acidobacteriota bacterium]|nr:MFS transporter [Acidobacteriota bacterium]